MHGGTAKRGPQNKDFKTGERSVYLGPLRMRRHMDDITEEAGDVLDLTRDIMRVEAATREMLETAAYRDSLDRDTRAELRRMLETKSQLVGQWHKILTSDTVPRLVVEAFLIGLRAILAEELAGEHEHAYAAVLARIDRLVGQGGGGTPASLITDG